MNQKEIRQWTKKEFEDIHKSIKHKSKLSYNDFLRIRNFKANNFTYENDRNVKKITSKAFKLAKQDKIEEAIKELVKLHGVAIPVASAILSAKFPNKYAIIDINVLRQLKKKSWIKDYRTNPDTYKKYISLMRGQAKRKGLRLRDYERMLFEK